MIGAVISPGPVTTAIVSQAPRSGWLTGPLVSVGHAVMELAMLLLITLGLSGLLGSPAVQSGVALTGGLVLLWMAFGLLRGALRGEMRLPDGEKITDVYSPAKLLTLGMAASASNPFWYAWWMTVASVYLLQAQTISVLAVAAFFFGHISVDFLWNTFLSAVIGGGRRWLTNRVYAGIIVACAGYIAFLGVQFLLNGARLLAG